MLTVLIDLTDCGVGTPYGVPDTNWIALTEVKACRQSHYLGQCWLVIKYNTGAYATEYSALPL